MRPQNIFHRHFNIDRWLLLMLAVVLLGYVGWRQLPPRYDGKSVNDWIEVLLKEKPGSGWENRPTMDERAVPYFVRAIEGRFDDPEALIVLLRWMPKSPQVGAKVRELYFRLLYHQDARVNEIACSRIGDLNIAMETDVLQLLSGTNTATQLHGCHLALGIQNKDQRIAGSLVGLLKSSRDEIRQAAALGLLGSKRIVLDPAGLEQMSTAVTNLEGHASAFVAIAFSRTTTNEARAVDVLFQSLGRASVFGQIKILERMGQMRSIDARYIPEIKRLSVEHESEDVQVQAATLLLKDPASKASGIQALQQLAGKMDRSLEDPLCPVFTTARYIAREMLRANAPNSPNAIR